MNWRAILLAVLAIGIWYWRWQSGRLPLEDGQRIRITARLDQQPTVKVDKWTGEEYGWVWLRVGSEQIGMRRDLGKELNYGDIIRADGTLKSLSEPTNDGWSKMRRRDVWMLSNPEVKIVSQEENISWWGKMNNGIRRLRERLLGVYRGVLPRNETGLLIGMVLGIKGELSEEFSIQLRNSGMIHVVVASGYNVMLLAALMSGALMIWWKRQVAVTIAVVVIWFYVWLAGGEAPVVRAGLMGSLAYLGIVLGREREAGWLLVMSGVLMLWWKPEWLWDVGWQLSMAATAGLIWIEPKLRIQDSEVSLPLPSQINAQAGIQKLFKKIFEMPVVGESLRTTMAAQVAVFPIIMMQFGKWPWWSLVVNAALLWMVPVITSVGMVVAVVGLFFKPVAMILMWLIWPLLKIFVEVVEIAGAGNLMEWKMPWWAGILYYGVLIWWVRRRTRNLSTNSGKVHE